MKTNKPEIETTKRNRYTLQFKEQAIERAKRDGVPQAAKDLGIAQSMLYGWQSKSRQTGQSVEDQKLQQAELARLKRDNARLEEEVAFLKKAVAYFAKQPPVRYAMIQQHEQEFSVGLMYRLLSVSRSGYYQWKKRPPSKRHQIREALAVEVKRIFEDEKNRVGSPRIAKRLNAEGRRASRHAVAKIMRRHGWRARAAKKYKATTNSNHSLPVAPNLLAQNFEATAPDQKWVSETLPISSHRLARR
jgi:transposase-like protein